MRTDSRLLIGIYKELLFNYQIGDALSKNLKELLFPHPLLPQKASFRKSQTSKRPGNQTANSQSIRSSPYIQKPSYPFPLRITLIVSAWSWWF